MGDTCKQEQTGAGGPALQAATTVQGRSGQVYCAPSPRHTVTPPAGCLPRPALQATTTVQDRSGQVCCAPSPRHTVTPPAGCLPRPDQRVPSTSFTRQRNP